MTPFLSLPAAQPLALFSVLLVLKMFGLAAGTALKRVSAKIVVNLEDVKVNPGSHAEAQDAEATLRVKRAHLNDLENIPGFLALALIFTLAGGSSTAGWGYFGVYFAARVLHSFFYLSAMQPFRTASFAIGQLTMVGLCVQILMLAF